MDSTLLAPLTTEDGLALHVREWPATTLPAHGTVLVVHGLGEHIGRYEHVAQTLSRAGWRVIGYDQRGHGASDGARGVLAHADALLNDLARVIDAVRAARPGPVVLLGHSLGGLVAARFVAGSVDGTADERAWAREVDALVLSSPALNAGMSSAQRLLLAATAPLTPNLAVGNGLKPEWLSRDPAVVQAYGDDPLVHDRITPRLAQFIVDAGTRVQQRAPRWRVPTLLLYAGADRCVAPAGSATFTAAAPAGVMTAREWPALFHEIFNEPEREEVMAVLVEWLGARFAS
ncbi:MAG: lysophospholipase [Burkholderiaceae bacterium]